jgi:hypothetical protein
MKPTEMAITRHDTIIVGTLYSFGAANKPSSNTIAASIKSRIIVVLVSPCDCFGILELVESDVDFSAGGSDYWVGSYFVLS